MAKDSVVQRELRYLRAYAALSGAVLVVLSIAAFRRDTAQFDEIEVHRINVREPDGKLRLVISDKARSSGPIDHGKPFGRPGGDRGGITFYNDEETEDGGLVFDGAEANGALDASGQLSFDQYGADQIVYLQYADQKGYRSAGLYVDDQADVPGWADSIRRIYALPAGPVRDSARRVFDTRLYNGAPIWAHRAFLGRDYSHNAILRLDDSQGRTRLRILVDSLGGARIEFLDEQGRVVRSL